MMKGIKKGIIIAGVIIIAIPLVLASAKVYKQKQLVQHFASQKGDNMKKTYWDLDLFLHDMIKESQRILNTSTNVENYRVEGSFDPRFYRLLSMDFGRHEFAGPGASYYHLHRFVRDGGDYIRNVHHKKQLGPKDVAYVYSLYSTANKLLDIMRANPINTAQMSGPSDFYYGDELTKVIDKLNTAARKRPYSEGHSLEVFWEKTLNYKDYSIEDAKDYARQFLGSLDTIRDGSYLGTGQVHLFEDMPVGVVQLRGDKGYEVKVFTKGMKMAYVWDAKWNASIPGNDHVDEKKAAENLMEFLKQRGISSLEIKDMEKDRNLLKVSLVHVGEEYVNEAMEIKASLDLSNNGKVVYLDLQEYWKGKVYNDIRKEIVQARYDVARQALKSNISVKKQSLVGVPSNGYYLDFYWRFTTRINGKDYHIYVDVVTGNEVKRVRAY